MGGNQHPNPDSSTTHIKCIKGKKLKLPVKKKTKVAKKHVKHAKHAKHVKHVKHAKHVKHGIKHQGKSGKHVRKTKVYQTSFKAEEPRKTQFVANYFEPAEEPGKIPKTSPKTFESDCLNRHNEHRRKLSTKEGPVQELQWSDELAEKARQWARQLVRENSDGGISLRHSTEMDWGFGENLYSSKGGNQSCATTGCTVATDAWFNEWPIYKGEKIPGGKFKEYGHYTQLAWPSTRYVGCACVNNGESISFIACEYDPPGNIDGQRLGVFFKQSPK
jgi:uncharacterized protein YkwD